MYAKRTWIVSEERKENSEDDLEATFRNRGLEEYIAEKNSNFESRMVKEVLKFYGLGSVEKDLRGAAKRVTGEGSLNFRWFDEFYPSFPVRLGARSLPYVFKWGPSQCRKHFTSSPMWKAFEDVRDNVPEHLDNGQIGVIFYWNEYGNIVLSNYDHDIPTCTHFQGLNLYNKRFWMEDVKSFLGRLNWHPG